MRRAAYVVCLTAVLIGCGDEPVTHVESKEADTGGGIQKIDDEAKKKSDEEIRQFVAGLEGWNKANTEIERLLDKRLQLHAEMDAYIEATDKLNALTDVAFECVLDMDSREIAIYHVMRDSGMHMTDTRELCEIVGVTGDRYSNVEKAIDYWGRARRLSRTDEDVSKILSERNTVPKFTENQLAEKRQILTILSEQIDSVAREKKKLQSRNRPVDADLQARMDRYLRMAAMFGHSGIEPDPATVSITDPEKTEPATVAHVTIEKTPEQQAEADRKARKRSEWIDRLSRTYLTDEKLKDRILGLGFDNREVEEMMQEIGRIRAEKRAR
jgi:hypothetical protein